MRSQRGTWARGVFQRRTNDWRIFSALLIFGLRCLLPAIAEAQSPPPPASSAPAQAPNSDSILGLDIDQLAKTPVVVPSMDIPVTSVTKEASTVGRSAAAVFVITNEMIRRSGATCIPEALRMAPGLDVAQVNSNAWAISARGVNHSYANMLLVLIDGRSVYNPDLAGVYWNQQDVLLEDVDRIEVIRGPGGTLWGANAVNGVINIITKRAKDTQGTYVMAGGGSHDRDMEAFRYGGQLSDDCQYRIYGKHFDRGMNYDPNDLVDDSWRQGRFGFRADWQPGGGDTDQITFQGDHYVGSTNNSVVPAEPALPENQNGDNLLARWRHTYDEDTDWTLQAYYDMWSRAAVMQTELVKTFDVEFQYRFRMTERQQITCGCGFRNVDSYWPGGDTFTTYFPAPYWTTNYSNEFAQDEITIVDDRLAFIIGCKLEQNPYTGPEYEPTARLLWTPDRRHTAWGAISRAIRAPDRVDHQSNITFPPLAPDVYPRTTGNPAFRSEVLFAYELGYRTQATDKFSWDVATFYNVYDQFLTYEPLTPEFEDPNLIIPMKPVNHGAGESYGIELACNYAISDTWRLYAQYTVLQMHLHDRETGESLEFPDPNNQIYLRSAWDLNKNLEFDLIARYIDELVVDNIPNYITMDARLAWRPRDHWEVAVVGQNLLQEHHWEFAGNTPSSPAYATEVPRSVYGTLTWRH